MTTACGRATEPSPTVPTAATDSVSVAATTPVSQVWTTKVAEQGTRLAVYGHLVADADKRDYWSANVAQNLFVASKVGGESRKMEFELNLDKLPAGIGKADVTLIGTLRVVNVPAVPRGEQSYGRATRTYLDVEQVVP
jgi:hypothetical protein